MIKTSYHNVKKLLSIMNEARDRNLSVMAFFVGTKPCFNKIYGTIKEYRKKKLPFFIVNVEQHYDDELTYMAKEFGLEEDILINFHIRGDLFQKAQELQTKTAELAKDLKHRWKNVRVYPVVLGDTIICPTVASAWMLTTGEKCIHLEAGLRSMELGVRLTINRDEPFPEQWCTFTASAACEHHLVPVELNKDNLVLEGYKEENIHVVGGMITDAIEFMKNKKREKSVFDTYPTLKKGLWVRVDIHRRENTSGERFLLIWNAIEEIADSGIQINVVLYNTFKNAVKEAILEDRLKNLSKKKNVLVTEVWESYADVYEFYTSDHFLAAVTDSGGVQEDMNILGKPCITIRNSTDRPETIDTPNPGNILISPGEHTGEYVLDILNNMELLERMASAKKLYGSHTGKNVADVLESIAQN